LNKFSDLTKEEFESRYLGDSGVPEDAQPADSTLLEQGQFTPIDWRTKNVVGPVKDQGHCGSCWSFSTVGPTEEHYAIKYGRQVVLSEQQLVDCSWAYDNNGCNGGLFA
jgi:C1A family cysteine protease